MSKFIARNLLYISPFTFPNGNKSKPKYFIVLVSTDSDMVIASLPTKQDHIPRHITKRHGCISNDTDRVNCYCFLPSKEVCCNGFCFPIDTYVYGEQVANFEITEITSDNKCSIEFKGKLTEDEFDSLIKCFKGSSSVKNKYKKLL